MKTVVIIVSVLAVITVVYGFDVTRLQKYTADFIKCNEEMGGSPSEPRIDIIQCATIRDGEVLNANGEYIRAKALERLGDLISDAAKLEQANAIYNKCYDDVVSTGVTGKQQTANIIKCALTLLPLIDKLE